MKLLSQADFWIGFLGIVPLNYVLFWLLLGGYQTAHQTDSYFVPTPLIWVWHTAANLAWVVWAYVARRRSIIWGTLTLAALCGILLLIVAACVSIYGLPGM